MNFCQIILQRGCSNLYFQLQFVFWVWLFKPTMLAHFERTDYKAVLFSKYIKLWPFSSLMEETYAMIISLLPTSDMFSSLSPVRWESLPRVKAFCCCCCFWQNHGLCVMESIHLIPFVRLHVLEVGRDCLLERLWASESHSPGALGLNPDSASYWLCAFMNIWVTKKRHVPGTVPRVWVTKNKAYGIIVPKTSRCRQCHVVSTVTEV